MYTSRRILWRHAKPRLRNPHHVILLNTHSRIGTSPSCLHPISRIVTPTRPDRSFSYHISGEVWDPPCETLGGVRASERGRGTPSYMRASLIRDYPPPESRLAERAKPSTLPDSTTTMKKTRVSAHVRRRPPVGLHLRLFPTYERRPVLLHWTAVALAFEVRTVTRNRPSIDSLHRFILHDIVGTTCVRTPGGCRGGSRVCGILDALSRLASDPSSIACLRPATRHISPSLPLRPRLWRMGRRDQRAISCYELFVVCLPHFVCRFSKRSLLFADASCRRCSNSRLEEVCSQNRYRATCLKQQRSGVCLDQGCAEATCGVTLQ
jgi:hypothetical protein